MTLDNNLHFKNLGDSGASKIYDNEGKKISHGYSKKRVQLYTNDLNSNDRTSAIGGRILNKGEKATLYEKMTHITIKKGVGENQQTIILNISSLSKRTKLTKSEIKKFHKEGTLETEIQKKLESQENIIRLNLKQAEDILNYKLLGKYGTKEESAAIHYEKAANAGSSYACIWMGEYLKNKAYSQNVPSNAEGLRADAKKYLEMAKQGLQGEELNKVNNLLKELEKPLPKKQDYSNKKIQSFDVYQAQQERQKKEKADQAVEHFEFLFSRQPNDVDIRNLLENAKKEQAAKHVEYYEFLFSRQPNDVDIRNLLENAREHYKNKYPEG